MPPQPQHEGEEGEGGATTSSQAPSSRRATHAGSWYPEEREGLDALLQQLLHQARTAPGSEVGQGAPFGPGGTHGEGSPDDAAGRRRLKALIVPHAGYRYSGQTAAYAYAALQPHLSSSSSTNPIRRIFVLAPSHHVYLPACAISTCPRMETPLGPLHADTETVEHLRKTQLFLDMSQEMDEEEHAAEMQFPFLARGMAEAQTSIPIVSLLVGDLDEEREEQFAALLLPYLLDEESVFVLSTDFCHWGSRFNFTAHDSGVELHQSIERLDRLGMRELEHADHAGFATYLAKTRNTICGRHPLSLFLRTAALAEVGERWRVQGRFLHYAQSSRITQRKDSSVSYAAGVMELIPPREVVGEA